MKVRKSKVKFNLSKVSNPIELKFLLFNILSRYVEISVQPNKTVAKDRHPTGQFYSLMNQKQMMKAKTYGKRIGKGLMMTPDAEKLSPEIEKQCSQKCVTGRLATRWRHTTQRRLTPEKNKSLRITQAKLKAVLRG